MFLLILTKSYPPFRRPSLPTPSQSFPCPSLSSPPYYPPPPPPNSATVLSRSLFCSKSALNQHLLASKKNGSSIFEEVAIYFLILFLSSNPAFICYIVFSRFYYENPGIFTRGQLVEIRKSSLARLLCDNGDNIDFVPREAFRLGRMTPCSQIPQMDLSRWKEL